MRNSPEAEAYTELELQVDRTAIDALDKRVSMKFATDRSEMALRWLHRWRLDYLKRAPDLRRIGEKTVAVTVTVDPSLLEVLAHYPGCSPAEIASAVVNAEGRHSKEMARRDRLIMKGRYNYDV